MCVSQCVCLMTDFELVRILLVTAISFGLRHNQDNATSTLLYSDSDITYL